MQGAFEQSTKIKKLDSKLRNSTIVWSARGNALTSPAESKNSLERGYGNKKDNEQIKKENNVYENTEVDEKEQEWMVPKHNQSMRLCNKIQSRSNEAMGSQKLSLFLNDSQTNGGATLGILDEHVHPTLQQKSIVCCTGCSG
jgi:hypothetical protein